ncbi:hypothetical protein AB4156_07390 [Cupriavidus sp. 2MCAB6]|uniref:hypothetical protein n=1 Tax=Cupriavidus sp. 2MCAB6 TaxID=3232981 RepID=UPI003F910476
MTFTDWEVDAIRRGLNCYRIANARQGRLLPWKAVIHAVLMSEVTAHVYPKNGEEPEFKEEALRRFANGSQILQPDKLTDLKAFLIQNKSLTEEDFGNESKILAEAKAVQSLLGANTIYTASLVSGMRSHYKAIRNENPKLTEEIELRILPQGNGGFFLTEETYAAIQHLSPQEYEREKQDNLTRSKEIRRGYGFLFTGDDLIHIVLRGYREADRIHFVEFMPLGEKAYPDFFMLRLGSACAPSVDGNNFQTFMHNANALKFEVISSISEQGSDLGA